MSDPVFNGESIRGEFPFLNSPLVEKKTVYLDNAATTQKPKCVIDRLHSFYSDEYATIHRGAYFLSERATNLYAESRKTVAEFLGAGSEREIVFTRGTTEAINLVAYGWGDVHIQAGDRILISAMEHHANIVPWQMLCARRGALLDVMPMDERGELILEEAQKQMDKGPKLVAFNHVSNALGTINPAQELCKMAKQIGALVLIDGAQSTAHMQVRVQELGCDFYAFSAHKVYGPTGVGALWAKKEVLQSMQPFQGGGDMITRVTFEKTDYADVPRRFEAGTPAIAEAIGLKTALDWLQALGLSKVEAWEKQLFDHAMEGIADIPGLKVIGEAKHKAGLISFAMTGAHPHDIATILDLDGVCIRAGHHCAQPVMDFFKVPATARASFGVYNTMAEVDQFIASLHKVLKVFS